ncbi:MAG: hypothetical protein Q8O89_03915 [Nanoarchaeota archaeon]|nr:hypothetical protein [Nanoarchaeota archaeon]
MQSGLLITCPENDDATAYLSFYSKFITEEADKRSLRTKVIKDRQLNMKDFSEIMKKIDYKLVVLNGHGAPDSIFGYRQNIIIKLGENDGLLKDRIVYARSCDAGSLLGPECMKGTSGGSFIGYNKPFIFFVDQKWSAKPSNDNVAKLFLEPSNVVPISLIKGNTASESHDNAKKHMLRTMNKLIKLGEEHETPFYLAALWNNYSGQVIYGNGETKL